MNRATLLSAVPIAASLLTGCHTVSLPNEPTVSLADIRIGNVTLLESSATITVRIENENPVPLPIRGAGYELAFDGTTIGKGVSGDVMEVPAFGSTTQVVEIHLDNITAVRKIAEVVKTKKISYRLRSNLYPTSDSKLSRLSLTKEGELDAKTFTDLGK